MTYHPRQTLFNRILQRLPRHAFALVAELIGRHAISGSESGEQGGFWNRLRNLVRRDFRSPHYLFDPIYYLDENPDVKASRWPPLLHFVMCGGFEGRKPHCLFDPAWYLDQNPDVDRCGLNPLQHYCAFGWRESRSPHPLFDIEWYLHTYTDVKAAGLEPVGHFISWGASEGRNPHPLFDTHWYVQRYPQLKAAGINPLIHFISRGRQEHLNPNRYFDSRRYLEQNPDASSSRIDPLTHYLTVQDRGGYNPHPGYPRPGRRSRARELHRNIGRLSLEPIASEPSYPPTSWRNAPVEGPVPIFVVYGRSNIGFIESHLIPALAARDCRTRLHLHLLNYRTSTSLLSADALRFSSGSLTGVTDWSVGRNDCHIGFGEAVNYLFGEVKPRSCFFLINPDSMPMQGCLDTLIDTYSTRHGAIVEARQWPAEHPKEFDAVTRYTPWASGAFLLISSRAFRQLNGFDPIYFLYNEDVDLSWRAWLAGMPVLYERSAMCAHFTGALSYGPGRFYFEQFFGIRNSLIIAYKFFGDEGEAAAWKWIEHAKLPHALYERVRDSYLCVRKDIQVVSTDRGFYKDQIKILGLNLYHELRLV